MRRIVILAAVATALAIVWWLASPLFLDETVDEDFPISLELQLPEGMEESDAMATMDSAAADDMRADDTMDDRMVEAMVVSRGSFRDVDAVHRGSGEAAIYLLEDGDYVLRLEGLDVTNGPDLFVTLSRHPDPTNRDELHDGFVEVAPLKGNRGNQNYTLPADVDAYDIGSVSVYCRAFGVLFSVAPLELEAEG